MYHNLLPPSNFGWVGVSADEVDKVFVPLPLKESEGCRDVFLGFFSAECFWRLSLLGAQGHWFDSEEFLLFSPVLLDLWRCFDLPAEPVPSALDAEEPGRWADAALECRKEPGLGTDPSSEFGGVFLLLPPLLESLDCGWELPRLALLPE